jgi:hypothetical protein
MMLEHGGERRLGRNGPVGKFLNTPLENTP